MSIEVTCAFATQMATVDHIVTGSLDDATHQELIENFITRVGAAR